MKKVHLLSLIPALLLASCGEFKPYGVYQFRLGKTDGSHLELTTELTSDDYASAEGYKRMYISADLGDEMSLTKILDDYALKYPIAEELIEHIEEKIKTIKRVEMYYALTDIQAKPGYRLAIGSDFLSDLIKEIFPEAEKIAEEMGLTLRLTPELTRYVFSAYVNSTTLTFAVPVSLDDIIMQLAWYGYYVDTETTDITRLDLSKMPGPEGDARFGVHPAVKKDEMGNIVSNEADDMNNIFENEFSNTHLYQKDGEGNEVEVANFVTHVDANGRKQLYAYLTENYSGSQYNVEGYIYKKDLLGEYTDKVDLKFAIDDEHKTNTINNGKEDKQEGFIDSNETEVRYQDFIKTPFTFRDFHEVDIGLTKN